MLALVRAFEGMPELRSVTLDFSKNRFSSAAAVEFARRLNRLRVRDVRLSLGIEGLDEQTEDPQEVARAFDSILMKDRQLF